jgi:hypothetical protein
VLSLFPIKRLSKSLLACLLPPPPLYRAPLSRSFIIHLHLSSLCLPPTTTVYPPSHSYKQSTSLTSVPDAVNSLTRAIKLLTELGRFRQAADRQKEVGTLLKESDLPAARDAFVQAGEWYSMEDAQA